MKKIKRGLSLILVVAIMIGACFIGGVISASAEATVVEEGNLLLNGSFEQNRSMNLGFTDMELKNGQINYVGVEAWRYRGHYYVVDGVTHTEKQILATHDYADALSGNFALKFTNQGTGDLEECTAVIFPDGVVGDVADYATGHYRFSVWVKGTNTASYIACYNAAGTRTQVDITDIKEDEWTQIVIDNITGIGTTTVTPTNEEAKVFLNLNLVVQTQDTATEILFDDAKLERIPFADPNLIIQSGFENSNGATIGNTNQTNSFFENTWTVGAWRATGVSKYATSEAHTGNWALRIDGTDSGSGRNLFNIAAANDGVSGNLDTSKIVAGKYRLSLWVKGTATQMYLQWGTNKVYVPESAASEWTQLVIEDIAINSVDDLTISGTGSGSDRKRYSDFGFYAATTVADTYVIIDDICLERIEESKNVLIKGDFEETQGTATEGYDIQYSQGGTRTWLSGWVISLGNIKTFISSLKHVKDAASRKWAVELKTADATTIGSKTWEAVSFYPQLTNINEEKLTPGTYKLSAWVKGDNRKAYLLYNSTKVYVPETASDTWTKIEISNITINSIDDIPEAGDGGGTNAYRYKMGMVIPCNPSTTLAFDNVIFEKLDTIDDVKDQITGIAQPDVGDTELTLPTLDTNNDAITVSIAASSDENIIALDGTITTPKVQTVVDITLQISDGTNTVTLDPIGVLVHGELDTITQSRIEAAIDALNVKTDGAQEAIAEIDGWLEFKPTYVSTEKKNLYSQKTLVFGYDPYNDGILDAKDINVVRTELLSTESEKGITVLVKAYKKVVEYKSYSN